MSNQLAGFPAFGNRIDTNIVYHPKAYLPETPVAIPNSEPTNGAGQVQFTFATGDLPTTEPVLLPYASGAPNIEKYVVYTIMGFYNNSGSSATISLKHKANSTTYSGSGSMAVANARYNTAIISLTLDSWNIGDTHEVKIWCNQAAGVELRWAYMVIAPLRLCSGLPGLSVANLEIDISGASWIGAAAVQNVANYANWQIALMGTAATYGNYVSISPPNDYARATVWRIPLSTGQSQYQYLMGCKTLAAQGASSPLAGGDAATETKKHGQPFYPTRVAFTPILL